MENKEIIYLVGLPGSGKSTYLINNGYVDGENCSIISNDLELEIECKKQNKTYSELWGKIPFSEINKRTFDKFNNAVNSDVKTIIIDNTNMNKKARRKYVNNGYKRIAVVFETPEDVIYKRLENRNKTGKVITKDIIENMKNRYQPVNQAEEHFYKVTKVK